MNIEVHILTSDYSWILPWTLRHYTSFADRVIVHSGGPDFTESGWTRRICNAFPTVEWRMWDTAGQLNDDLAMKLKNSCWRDTSADWVAVVDDDELLWFPDVGSLVTPVDFLGTEHRKRARARLDEWERIEAVVIKPRGFEMFSDTLPELGQTTQIWCAIKEGARDDKWYAKPALFSPRRVADSGFGVGAHEARVVTKSGLAINVDKDWPQANPPLFLLHCHQIGPASFVAERYDATRRRLAEINVRNNWGNVRDSGAVHVEHKRSLILPRLERVIP